jgi:hypothetical protein
MPLKPWQLIMKNYLWDLEAEHPHYPACPNCLTKVVIALSFPAGGLSVSVICPSCALQGPCYPRHDEPFLDTAANRKAAMLRWNQFIERTYHLAHGMIPAPKKKKED